MNSNSATGESRYADDRYADQRRRGFPWLRFAPELEREYRDSFFGLNLKRIRVAGVLALLSVVGFMVLDQFFGSNLMTQFADLILIAFCAPAAAIPLAATFLPSAKPWLTMLNKAGILAVSAGVLAAVMIGRDTQTWFPYESLLLLTAYIYFVSGLMFYEAMLFGTLVWFGFIVSNWSLQQHSMLLYEGYYLAIANWLGWLGLYLLDHQSRMQFLLRHEIQQQATMDGLTGLMNRRAFTARIEMIWRQAGRDLCPVGVVLMDLDRFKLINDTCGHQFGDRALVHVANVLKAAAVRPLDAAARYGGDEFIAVWYDVDGAWLARLAEEMPSRIEGLSCGEPDRAMAVTVSGGAVLAWPRPGMEPHDAIRLADQLLYEVKRNQPGRLAHVVLRKDDDRVIPSAARDLLPDSSLRSE